MRSSPRSIQGCFNSPAAFLLVGLIAAIRRVLVPTAEAGHAGAEARQVTTGFLIELGVLTALIVALAVSLYVLRKQEKKTVAHRA